MQAEISSHEVLIVKAIRTNSDKWLTNHEIAEMVGDVSGRTVRAYTRKLVDLGVLDHAKVFPAHRYRWSGKASKKSSDYARSIDQAAEAFGI